MISLQSPKNIQCLTASLMAVRKQNSYMGNVCHDHNYCGMTEHPSSLGGGDSKSHTRTLMYYNTVLKTHEW